MRHYHAPLSCVPQRCSERWTYAHCIIAGAHPFASEVRWRDTQRTFALVDDHPWPTALHVAHVALLGVIHLHGAALARLAVVRRQRRRLAQRRLRNGPPAALDDHMRAGDPTGMQPEVVRSRLMKGHLLVLAAILAHQQRKAIARLAPQRRPTARALFALLCARLALLPLATLRLFARAGIGLRAQVARLHDLLTHERDLRWRLGQREVG